MNQNDTELRKLIKRWKKRRDKLGKQASAVGKIKTEANQRLRWELFGEFCEIERCRSQLTAILNKMDKKSD